MQWLAMQFRQFDTEWIKKEHDAHRYCTGYGFIIYPLRTEYYLNCTQSVSGENGHNMGKCSFG
jgi:hypothetical protein